MSRLAPQAYETKYADFIRLCSEAKARNVDHILVAKPFILGDTYDEITESLSRLAEAGLALRVAGR